MIERYGDLAHIAGAALTEFIVLAAATMDADPEASSRPLDSHHHLRAVAVSSIDHVRRAMIYIDIQTELGPELERLDAVVARNARTEETYILFRALRERVSDLLKNEFFFHLDRRDVPLYGKPQLFGAQVGAKFPKHIEDVEAAGNCLALNQPTACVFHLMRVMEGAVQRLGKLLNVKLDPKKETWFEICNRVSTAVTNRPAKTKAMSFKNAALSAAVAHLQTVRIAWRNEVMHPKQTYTRDEAHEVFNATRIFMVDLAGLV